MEVTIQIVPGDVCGIITAPGTALGLPFDRGLDTLYTADPVDSLVVDHDPVLFVQFIPDPTVSHIRMGIVDVFDSGFP